MLFGVLDWFLFNASDVNCWETIASDLAFRQVGAFETSSAAFAGSRDMFIHLFLLAAFCTATRNLLPIMVVPLHINTLHIQQGTLQTVQTKQVGMVRRVHFLAQFAYLLFETYRVVRVL